MSRGLIIAVVLLFSIVLAMGAVVWYLRRDTQQQPVQNAPVAPPIAEAQAQVTLVLANDADGSLVRSAVSVSLPQSSANRPREVMKALVAKCLEPGVTHPLPAGADVNDVYTNGSNLAIVDVNAAFADGHRSGVLVEELTLGSMTETLAANIQGITRMKLLVDGKERPTLAGHADLSDPYDISFDAGRVRAAR
jgi:hypothetical protein